VAGVIYTIQVTGNSATAVGSFTLTVSGATQITKQNGAGVRFRSDPIDPIHPRSLAQTIHRVSHPPSVLLTKAPTKAPTKPTKPPTKSPTKIPSKPPTKAPTKNPTKPPTRSPTQAPTNRPSKPPTGAPTNLPTFLLTDAPTDRPTDAPTHPPTNLPSSSPSTPPPSERPTEKPTSAPTSAPVLACTGGATHWIYDPTTDLPLQELINNTVVCVPNPYNLEVRPCGGGGTQPAVPRLPVVIKLQNATLAVVRRQSEAAPPFFFWGDDTAAGDVFPSRTPLSNGVYYLSSTFSGRIRFTQACP
jgi:hypothetical protein